jgi:hypothetical protein
VLQLRPTWRITWHLVPGELDAILLAVVADLRHLQYVIEWAGEGKWLLHAECALAHFASDRGGDLEKIAASIEDAMADPKGTMEQQRVISDAAVFIQPREVAL